MIKRPLDIRFGEKVRLGVKTTTIRASAWPVGRLIMLYHWSGRPYASKQCDVAAVRVASTHPITVTHGNDGRMEYSLRFPDGVALWCSEGFNSEAEMDEWFRPKVRRDSSVERRLMVFRRVMDEEGKA